MRTARIFSIVAALAVVMFFGVYLAQTYLPSALKTAQMYPHVVNILVLVAGLHLLALSNEMHLAARLSRAATYRFAFFQALNLLGFHMMTSPFDMEPVVSVVTRMVPGTGPYVSGLLALIMVVALLGVALSIIVMVITLAGMLLTPQPKQR